MTLPSMIKIFLPTIWLFYCLAWGNPGPSPLSTRESFGAADHYLDIYYEINPDGLLQLGLPIRKARFMGYWVSGDRVEVIHGYRRRQGANKQYVFDAEGGRFEGHLNQGILNFQMLSSSQGGVSRGALKAAFRE